MTVERALDVSNLPDAAPGTRAPVWWGQIGMMLIETVVFAIIIASYFYIRLGFSVWPPPNIAPPELWWPTVNLILVLLSCIPMFIGGKAIDEGRIGTAAFWLGLNIIMALGFLTIRIIEFNLFNFKWSTDVYGSLIWILVGLHTMHAIADTTESIVLFGIMVSGRMGAKQQIAAKLDGIYWYWIAAMWVVLYILIYIYPSIRLGTL